MEEPDRLQSMGLQRVRHDGATLSLSVSSHFFKVIKYIVKKLTKHMVEKFNQYSNVVSPNLQIHPSEATIVMRLLGI